MSVVDDVEANRWKRLIDLGVTVEMIEEIRAVIADLAATEERTGKRGSKGRIARLTGASDVLGEITQGCPLPTAIVHATVTLTETPPTDADLAVVEPASEPDTAGGITLIDPPAIPERLTFGELEDLTVTIERLSYSQLEAWNKCPMRWLLVKHLKRAEPAYSWALCGGAVAHECIEHIERQSEAGRSVPDIEAFCTQRLLAKVAIGQIEHGPHEEWLAYGRPSQGLAWWRAELPRMVNNYLIWADRARSAGWELTKIERQFSMEVECVRSTFASTVTVDGVVDQVWTRRETNEINVVDLKSGGTVPVSPLQLSIYGLWAAGMLIDEPTHVNRSFYMLRKGETIDYEPASVPALAAEVSQAVRSMVAPAACGAFTMRRDGECYRCPARDVCPGIG